MKQILQNIFSVKNIDEHKVITILGLKFKFKNINKILKKQYTRIEELEKQIQNKVNPLNIETSLLIDSWRNYGATTELIQRLSYYSNSKTGWDILWNRCFLIYLSCLIELNKTNDAINILNKYMSKYSEKEFENYMLVADFALKEGICNSKIEQTSNIYKKALQNKIEFPLEKLIIDKSIAIVGNGPSEIGKNKGCEIDAHDIVIRFNNFHTKNYENDYGKKTDVWVKCTSDDIKHHRSDINSNTQIIYETDFIHHELPDNYIEAMDYDIKHHRAYFLGLDEHLDIRNKFYQNPSTGIVIFSYIYKILGNLKKVDLYGFSCLQEKADSYASHYYNDRSQIEAINRSSMHNFKSESEYMRSLIINK